MAESEIGNNTPFVDLGLDSITGVTWIQKVNREYGTSLAATKVYAYPTLSDMSEYIFSQVAQQPVSSQVVSDKLPKTPDLPVKDSTPTESEPSIQATLKKCWPKSCIWMNPRYGTMHNLWIWGWTP